MERRCCAQAATVGLPHPCQSVQSAAGRISQLMRSVRVCAAAALLFFAITCATAAPPAKADTIPAALPGFDEVVLSSFRLDGPVTLSDSWLRLAPAANDQCGGAWWPRTVHLDGDRAFSAYFTVRFTQPGGLGGGADGVTFCIKPTADPAVTKGGGLGYMGITPSVAVELDTYRNSEYGDSDNNHVGIDVNGSVNSLAVATIPWPLKNGATYHVWIDYDGVSDQLEVRVNDGPTRPDTALLTHTIDIAAIVAPDVHLGFTGATGGGYANHEIGCFYFSDAYAPIDVTAREYGTAATALQVQMAADYASPRAPVEVTATATDPFGRPAAGQDVAFTAVGGCVEPDHAATAADGVARAEFTAGGTDGDATVTTACGQATGSVSIVVDGTPPQTQAEGPTDWSRMDVHLTLGAQDGGSGVAETRYRADGGDWATGAEVLVAAPADHSADGAHTVEFYSVDVAGNPEAVQSTEVRIDTSPPTVTADAPSAWVNQDTTVRLTAEDAGAGMSGGASSLEYSVDDGAWQQGSAILVPAPADHSADGPHTVWYRASDAAGNAAPEASAQVRIDTMSPVTTLALSCAPWAGSVPVQIDVDDGAGSSDARTEYRVDDRDWTEISGGVVELPAGDHTLWYRSVDAAGNVEAAQGIALTVLPPDTAEPQTSDDAPRDASGEPVWRTADVVVKLTAVDDGAPMSGGHTYYRIDAGNRQDGTQVRVPAATDHSMDGKHVIVYWSVDAAGNAEAERRCEVWIDTTAPFTRRTDGRLWFTATLDLRLCATDAGSGLAATTYRIDNGAWRPGVFVRMAVSPSHATDGLHTIVAYSTDRAGNAETVRTFTVGIDTQRPAVVLRKKRMTVRRGRGLVIAARVSDRRPSSGAASVTMVVKNRRGKVVKRAVFSASSISKASWVKWRFRCKLKKGVYVVRVSATDIAGNRQLKVAKAKLIVR